MKAVRPWARINVKIAPISPIKTPGTTPKSSCFANKRPIAKPPAAQAISNITFMTPKACLAWLISYPKIRN